MNQNNFIRPNEDIFNKIPVMTKPPKKLYENVKTFELIDNKKRNNYNNVQGIAHMPKFNPQKMGLPK